MTPALLAYRAATAMLEPAAPLLLRRRARAGKEEAARLPERLGVASRPRPPGPLAWLHGASVGEGLSLLPLAQALNARRPDLRLLLTTGTPTSAAVLAARTQGRFLHQYAPVDGPRALRRFLRHWRPDLAVFAESELWPNRVLAARGAGARLALLSARLSPASVRGWGRAPAAARRLLSAFDLVLAQDDAAAGALARLGARDDGRLNLKLAGAPPPVDAAALTAERGRLGGRPLVLAASTHPGEDELALDAYAALADPDVVLVLVPRHPARGGAVAQLARARGLAAGLRSAGDLLGTAPVHVADTLGELGLWYALADTALVSGSLLPGPGGHNPLEPARLGTPALAGPHRDNWREVYARLGAAVAPCADAATLAAAWRADLDDPAAAAARGERGRELAGADDGALDAAVERLLLLLPAAR